MCSVNPMVGKAPILPYVVYGQSHTLPQIILARMLISQMARISVVVFQGTLHASQETCRAILKSDVRYSYRRSRCSRGQPVCKAVVEGVKIDDRTGFQ